MFAGDDRLSTVEQEYNPTLIINAKLYDRRAGLVTEDDVELIRVPLPRHGKG